MQTKTNNLKNQSKTVRTSRQAAIGSLHWFSGRGKRGKRRQSFSKSDPNPAATSPIKSSTKLWLEERMNDFLARQVGPRVLLPFCSLAYFYVSSRERPQFLSLRRLSFRTVSRKFPRAEFRRIMSRDKRCSIIVLCDRLRGDKAKRLPRRRKFGNGDLPALIITVTKWGAHYPSNDEIWILLFFSFAFLFSFLSFYSSRPRIFYGCVSFLSSVL